MRLAHSDSSELHGVWTYFAGEAWGWWRGPASGGSVLAETRVDGPVE